MKDNIQILIDRNTLQTRIAEIAKEISKDFVNEDIVLICVLKGATYFAIDLSKYISESNVIMDFIKVSSYGSGTVSSGQISFDLDIGTDITNKNVIIIEDIIDTGITLNYLYKHLLNKNPKSLKICVLLDKKERRIQDIHVDYTGFEIENKFVVGYGLDYNEFFRNIPYIGFIE